MSPMKIAPGALSAVEIFTSFELGSSRCQRLHIFPAIVSRESTQIEPICLPGIRAELQMAQETKHKRLDRLFNPPVDSHSLISATHFDVSHRRKLFSCGITPSKDTMKHFPLGTAAFRAQCTERLISNEIVFAILNESGSHQFVWMLLFPSWQRIPWHMHVFWTQMVHFSHGSQPNHFPVRRLILTSCQIH